MHRHLLQIAAALAALALGAAVPVHAQSSLRGSRRSVVHAYSYAEHHDLELYRSAAEVRRAVRDGQLVRLRPNGHYTLHRVAYPYVTSTTRTFVERLASEYQIACGAPLEITSAVRPTRGQPANSSPLSVHPAGIALDLHRPSGACLAWLRHTLLTLESEGLVDATEERHPAHFHVIVFAEPYRRYLASR
ncbi:MAG TPA: DUF5715 family protein [Gemmatimonadaceae bacterium]|nr:DUF5715 family protein [Gemmatimonadaceae bacterium]